MRRVLPHHSPGAEDVSKEQPLIEWAGGDCPVESDALIAPEYRGASDARKGIRMRLAPAWRLAWHHDGEDDDIVGYRIVRP